MLVLLLVLLHLSIYVSFCLSIYQKARSLWSALTQDVLHLSLFPAVGLRWARKLFLMQPLESAAKILKTDSLPHFKGHLKDLEQNRIGCCLCTWFFRFALLSADAMCAVSCYSVTSFSPEASSAFLARSSFKYLLDVSCNADDLSIYAVAL